MSALALPNASCVCGLAVLIWFVCMQIRDLLRYSSLSPTLDAQKRMFSTADTRGLGEGIGGSSTHGAAGVGRGGVEGDGTGRAGRPEAPLPGDQGIANPHFSGGMGAGGHDIPEWVLEPASGKVPPSVLWCSSAQDPFRRCVPLVTQCLARLPPADGPKDRRR